MPEPDPVSRSREPLPTGDDVMADPLGWYAAWCAQQDRRRAADARLRESLQRHVRWVSWFIVGWTALICAATVAVIRFVL